MTLICIFRMPHDIFHLLEPAYRSLSRQQVHFFLKFVLSFFLADIYFNFFVHVIFFRAPRGPPLHLGQSIAVELEEGLEH